MPKTRLGRARKGLELKGTGFEGGGEEGLSGLTGSVACVGSSLVSGTMSASFDVSSLLGFSLPGSPIVASAIFV